MARRIWIWAGVGLLVASFWALYAAATFPTSLLARPIVWTLINVTCPIAYASFHFHFGIKLYWVLLTNAATYAALGLILEALHPKSQAA
jgi:hypothetical protein